VPQPTGTRGRLGAQATKPAAARRVNRSSSGTSRKAPLPKARLRAVGRPRTVCAMRSTSSSIAEVIARLAAIEAAAPAANGVACFARLYRQVTEAVDANLSEQGFLDSRFLEQLDLRFADLFFAAYDAYQQEPAAAPPAWLPLFTQQTARGVAPLQFALAGMNAHINRDLPVALVAVCDELGLELRNGSTEHSDFQRVNVLLGQVEQRIKSSYLTGWLVRLDRILHRVHRIDDVVAMWDVGRARDAAWVNGQTLWALRGQPLLATEFLGSLDRMVGFASRGLLVPADSLLRRLSRGRRLGSVSG
jgi:hypothetical protein